jgi:DNA polymerase III subunit gamma/tau
MQVLRSNKLCYTLTMSDLALYRKYRPSLFKEVLGQEQIINVLEESLKQGKAAHAYLFSGTRGTGKTSVARILARELGASSQDLYEIDGASNRGVDEIRELRENVGSLPFNSPVKVYIIDEVHMLTREAFNALLKTLEEPPSHVTFILATTELHKVPETIISRCQSFTFKQPSVQILEQRVLQVAKEEGFSFSDDAANLIAFLGEGSFRDTLGILQKVVTTSSDKKITAREVEAITGSPRSALILNFIESLLSGDPSRGLASIKEAEEDNIDMKVFLKLTMRDLRLAMLLVYAPKLEPELEAELGEDKIKSLKGVATAEAGPKLAKTLHELLVAYNSMGHFFMPQIALELAVMRLTN